MSQKKPADRRQGRGTQDAGVVRLVSGGSVSVPDAEPSWSLRTVERWREFWGSPLAGQVESSDVGALSRLFRLYDELERMWDAIEETGRVVAGSQGQVRPNPLFKQVEAFQGEARQLEDRFGLSPKSRLALGISFAEAAESLDRLNARLSERPVLDDGELWADEG